MVKSLENGVSLAPFLVKCFEMVNDDTTNELISWTESNDSFIIRDESKFSSQLLSKYFKHSNFSSFVRQLNIYGFRKIDSDRWEFANESFIKGQKHLLKNIARRKHPQIQLQRKPSQEKDIDTLLASEAEQKLALKNEVENLKTDKIALTQELAKLRQHQEISQRKLLLLAEQIKCMEKNQQQMLSFIVMAMQRPEFLMQFLQPKDKSWCVTETGKNKFSEVTDNYESAPSDGMIVRYQAPQDEETVQACNMGASKFDDLMDLEFMSDEMTDLLVDIDLVLGPLDDKMHYAENHGKFVVPDVPENDILLERLLLSSPTENEEFGELDPEGSLDSGMQIGSELQLEETNESCSLKDDDNEYRNQDGSSHNISEHNRYL